MAQKFVVTCDFGGEPVAEGKVEFDSYLVKMKKVEGELWGTAAKKDEKNGPDKWQEDKKSVQISVNTTNASKADLNSLPLMSQLFLYNLLVERAKKKLFETMFCFS